MEEKVISTLILKVDLDCRWCYKKIRKILCKLQEKERISTISYDDGSNSIAVVGAFDPHKLSCTIRCMAGKVIRGVEIMPPPMNNGKKKHKEMEPPPPPAEHELQPQPDDSHVSAVMMPAMMIEEEKPMMEERSTVVEVIRCPPAPKPVWHAAEVITRSMVEIPSCPAPAVAVAGHCGCSSCQPCYRGYYEGCRCCSVYGYAVGIVPAQTSAGFYGGGGCRSGCQVVVYCEEDTASACTVM